jgi:hypothetical protein
MISNELLPPLSHSTLRSTPTIKNIPQGNQSNNHHDEPISKDQMIDFLADRLLSVLLKDL